MALEVIKTKKVYIMPAVERCFEFLDQKNLIDYGSIISKQDIEEGMGRPFESDEIWETIGPMIQLYQLIQARGMFTTEKGYDRPAFRILTQQEMAPHAQAKLFKNLYSTIRINQILSIGETDQLNEAQKKFYEHQLKKSAQSAMHQQKILMGDQMF